MSEGEGLVPGPVLQIQTTNIPESFPQLAVVGHPPQSQLLRRLRQRGQSERDCSVRPLSQHPKPQQIANSQVVAIIPRFQDGANPHQ